MEIILERKMCVGVWCVYVLDASVWERERKRERESFRGWTQMLAICQIYMCMYFFSPLHVDSGYRTSDISDTRRKGTSCGFGLTLKSTYGSMWHGLFLFITSGCGRFQQGMSDAKKKKNKHLYCIFPCNYWQIKSCPTDNKRLVFKVYQFYSYTLYQ